MLSDDLGFLNDAPVPYACYNSNIDNNMSGCFGLNNNNMISKEDEKTSKNGNGTTQSCSAIYN